MSDCYCPRLRRAARLLRAGGVIAYPTEAVWGLGCNPADEPAIRRIIRLKGRTPGAGMILIADTAQRLQGWIAPGFVLPPDPPSPSRPLAITWIVPAGPRAHALVTGGRRTLAVRITRHALAAALCRSAGMPLVSTSANHHGRPPARTALEVRRRFGDGIDMVLNGPTGSARRPSEIRDARSGLVLRPG